MSKTNHKSKTEAEAEASAQRANDPSHYGKKTDSRIGCDTPGGNSKLREDILRMGKGVLHGLSSFTLISKISLSNQCVTGNPPLAPLQVGGKTQNRSLNLVQEA
jgi:hypothetical protein